MNEPDDQGQNYVLKNILFCDATKYNLVKFTEVSMELIVSIFSDV